MHNLLAQRLQPQHGLRAPLNKSMELEVSVRARVVGLMLGAAVLAYAASPFVRPAAASVGVCCADSDDCDPDYRCEGSSDPCDVYLTGRCVPRVVRQ